MIETKRKLLPLYFVYLVADVDYTRWNDAFVKDLVVLV